MSEITPDALLSRAPLTPHKLLNNEALVLSLENGDYFSLNGTGFFLWTCLEEPMRLETLATKLSAEYSLDHSQALTDVTAFATDLIACGLVKVVRGEGASPA